MPYGSESFDAVLNLPDDLSMPLAAEELALYEKKLQRLAKRQQTYLRQKTASDLRDALKRKELILCFEPIICAQTMKTTGANMVLRLQRHGFGLIPTQHILARVEGSAILIELGCWMITQILRHISKCPQGFVFTMRASPYQLRDYKFTSCLINLLGQNKSGYGHLALMLTDEELEQQGHELDGVLRMLTSAGVSFGICHTDDVERTTQLLKSGFFSTLALDSRMIGAAAQDEKKDLDLKRLIKKAQSCQCRLKVTGVDSIEQVVHCRQIGIDEVKSGALAPAVPLAALQSRVWLNRAKV